MISVLNLLGVNDRNKVEVAYNKGDLNKSKLNFTGNIPLTEYLKPLDMTFKKVVLGGQKSSALQVGEVDIVFNSICDADANKMTLENVREIASVLNKPVINDPANVLKTSRDEISDSFKDHSHFMLAKTIRVQPKSIKNIVGYIEEKKIEMPFIFREAGAHGGKKTKYIETIDQMDELEYFALDGRDFYMTEFVDFKSEDGLYRKYRMIIIDGKAYPRHMIASKKWAIHVDTRDELMPHSEQLREEEEKFLTTGAQTYEALATLLYEKVKLDFFGVDFAINRHGQIVLFEVNACMNSISVSVSPEPFGYHNKRHEEIKNAVLSLIRKKVKLSV